MSKGSRPRPYSVDSKTFSSNWDMIFKKKDTEVKDEVIDTYNDERLVSKFDKENLNAGNSESK